MSSQSEEGWQEFHGRWLSREQERPLERLHPSMTNQGEKGGRQTCEHLQGMIDVVSRCMLRRCLHVTKKKKRGWGGWGKVGSSSMKSPTFGGYLAEFCHSRAKEYPKR